MNRKQWVKPELIILGRSRSEETVLLNGCKLVSGGSGSTINANGCGGEKLTNCGSCQGRSGGTS